MTLVRTQQGERLPALGGPDAGIGRGTPQRLIVSQGPFGLKAAPAQADHIASAARGRVAAGQVLDELPVRTRRLAQAALRPAKSLIAAAGLIEFAGDTKMVPAEVVKLGGDDGDEGVHVPFGPSTDSIRCLARKSSGCSS